PTQSYTAFGEGFHWIGRTKGRGAGPGVPEPERSLGWAWCTGSERERPAIGKILAVPLHQVIEREFGLQADATFRLPAEMRADHHVVVDIADAELIDQWQEDHRIAKRSVDVARGTLEHGRLPQAELPGTADSQAESCGDVVASGGGAILAHGIAKEGDGADQVQVATEDLETDVVPS